ncbi:MAG: Tex family protein [Bacteroidales bacterium]|nr:Tex family protein [Bacteroidales bacterium]MDD3812514.1 Tex family protein [Bacteroidales bacterium]MDD3871568.1 Tex family protein [Bacteroidales bacterium]MDD4813362.1 Tex family protein [Bacteroidales bacterium]
MNEGHINQIASGLNLDAWQVRNTLHLFGEGATIPFVSRYRKEKTGSLDEVQLMEIKKQSDRLQELDARRQTILDTITEQGKLTADLEKSILNAISMTELEDLYLPYKPKRKTRGSKAREKGLEPLAEMIMQQRSVNPAVLAENYVNEEVAGVEEALGGARDIIAEWINEDQRVRNAVRRVYERNAFVKSKLIKGKEEEGAKYADYFEFHEPLKRCPSHRLLALFRGEREGFLRVSVEPEEELALERINERVLRNNSACAEQVQTAAKDAYKRLLGPSIETEYRNLFKEKADDEAIRVFADNLQQLLLMPPLGEKSILAIDPGFRTGCKVVCLDKQGNLVHNETIYPHPPQRETSQAAKKIKSLVDAYKIEAIAIGNGTASRETEYFIRNYVRFETDVQVYVVSENGASIYSASDVGREEFPDYDVTVRGSVSIGRRLMDPLAELVKIDPKSIGVGQYQHDVDQKRLQESLDQVVVSCVNKVGVQVNTASRHLLTYVSGLGPALARNITDYIHENGPVKSRQELLKVPRLGCKAFEQAAGFLRIRGGEHPLDNSAVHPESYDVVEQMARDLGCSVNDLITDPAQRSAIKLEKYVTSETGLPTLKDILQELSKPGRDPRGRIKIFEFSQDVHQLEDVKAGMVLPGIVTNITRFGAFVDIGVKQDGLVHVSQLADKYVSDPSQVVKLHQHVKVKVLEVDLVRKRIQLSMKGLQD